MPTTTASPEIAGKRDVFYYLVPRYTIDIGSDHEMDFSVISSKLER